MQFIRRDKIDESGGVIYMTRDQIGKEGASYNVVIRNSSTGYFDMVYPTGADFDHAQHAYNHILQSNKQLERKK